MDNARELLFWILGFAWTILCLYIGGNILMNYWDTTSWKEMFVHIFNGGLGSLFFGVLIVTGGWQILGYMFNQENNL